MRKLLVPMLVTLGITLSACVKNVATLPPGALHWAAATGSRNEVEYLLAQGADVNAIYYSRKPLHHAAYGGFKDVVELLVARGAEVNAEDFKYNATSLHYAAYGGFKEVVELLLSKGGDLNAKDKDGAVPLHYAALIGGLGGYKETVELLLSKGANVNAKDKNGGAPLHLAALFGHKNVVELLLSKGANVDVKDFKDGTTPLHAAAGGYGYRDVAELLVAKGAEVNAKDNDGRTPLDYANRALNERRSDYTNIGRKEAATFLVRHGAKSGKDLREGKFPGIYGRWEGKRDDPRRFMEGSGYSPDAPVWREPAPAESPPETP